jgi:hypothetical protein
MDYECYSWPTPVYVLPPLLTPLSWSSQFLGQLLCRGALYDSIYLVYFIYVYQLLVSFSIHDDSTGSLRLERIS